MPATSTTTLRRSGLTHVSVLVERLLARYGIDVHEFADGTDAEPTPATAVPPAAAACASNSYARYNSAESPMRVAEPLQQSFAWYANSELSV